MDVVVVGGGCMGPRGHPRIALYLDNTIAQFTARNSDNSTGAVHGLRSLSSYQRRRFYWTLEQ